MQITVQLAPELQAQLASESQARGMELDRYIAIKLGGSGSKPSFRQRDIEQAVENLRALRKGNVLGGLGLRELIDAGRKY